MSTRTPDPLRLDVAALAADAGEIAGEWPAAEMQRLDELQTPPQDTLPPPVAWSARGERRAVSGGEAQVWLHLQARTGLWLTCQRCLQPLAVPMVLESAIRFVRGEAQAEALDAESEHDVLALTRTLDLRALVEDELILALPIVPRHDACPQPLPAGPAPNDAPAAGAERENPFAALAGWRSPGR